VAACRSGIRGQIQPRVPPPDGKAYIAALAEQPENLVLEHLCEIRGDLRDIKSAFGNLTRRMDTLQSEMALIHRKFSDLTMEVTQITMRLDRIEKRLDLVEV